MPLATESPTAPPVAPTRRLIGWRDVLLFGVLTFVPLSLGGRGRLNGDTKVYLYLDPGDLMGRARVMWDAAVGGGTVTHQAIGYLWPMGPYYWLSNDLGIPAWLAQRWWVAGIQFFAALGVLALLRHLLPRHPAQLVGAALYGLSPFILGQVTSQSALLLPYAALGWLTLCVVLAVEDGGWRWPALFALIAATAGSINGSSLFFVLIGALLWLPYAVFAAGTATLRAGIATLFRLGTLTLLTSLWWLVAYTVGNARGLPILAITENVNTTNGPTSATEVLRGLGYWLFYGRVGGSPGLPDLAAPYITLRLLFVSFAVPVLALLLGGLAKWGPRAFFASVIFVGTVVAVGAYPSPRSPLGSLYEAAGRNSELVLTLRNTQRAVPLVILGLAGLAATGGIALSRRHARLGAAALVVLAVLVAADLPAQWREGLIAGRFSRTEIPSAWTNAGAYLDKGSGRVLQLPGIDFAAYRWGTTVDDILPGLTHRPVLARELVPLGGSANTSLLNALDRSMQEGTFEPTSLAPVARMLGISDILIRNDLEYERYRTARPTRVWDWVTDPSAGLGTPREFGAGYVNRAPSTLPMIDDLELGLQARDRKLPEVAVLPVPGGGRRLVSTAPVGNGVVLAGDGEGVVASAAAGLVDGRGSPLLFSVELDKQRFDKVTGPATRYIVTDSNRKRAERWYALRENFGATEPANEGVITYQDPSDARLEIAPGAPTSTQTVAEWRGAERVWASSYGNEFTLLPETRPVNAFDGDPRTAWLVDPKGPSGADPTVGIRLDHESHADHVTLVQPQIKQGTIATLRAQVVLDGTRTFDVDITPDQARSPGGVRVQLDGKPFRQLEVHILQTEPYEGFAGFAEVSIPDVKVEEMIRLPEDLFDKLGSKAGSVPLAVVLTRHRADPAEVNRSDPEWSMHRTFTVDAPLQLTLSGTARLHAEAPDARIDEALGLPGAADGGWSAQASGQVAGSLTQRGSAVFDGDPATWWSTPFDTVTGQSVTLDAGRSVRLDQLDVTVVADEEHSTPRQLQVSADGGAPVTVDLPVTTPGPLGTTERLRVPLPTPVTGQHLRVEVTGIDPRQVTDWFTQAPSTLPVAIAEIAVPGLPVRPLPATVDDTCRTDLLTVDDVPVGIRLSGSSTDALAGRGLGIETCDGKPITLAPGRDDIRTTPGADSGIDLDRLVLTTPRWTSVGATDTASATTVSSIQHHGPARANGTVHTDGRPFWLRLDQSVNDGWALNIDHAHVDGPVTLDSNSMGWLVTPERAGTLAYSVVWRPQRTVDIALLATALGALLCIGLVIAGWRRARGRARRAGYAAPELIDATNAAPKATVGTTIVVALATAVVAAIVIHPLSAVPAAVLAAVTVRRPRIGRYLPAALLAAAAAQVAWYQWREHYLLERDWAQHFGGAHVCAFLAVLLLAAGAAWDAWAPRGDAAPASSGSRGGDDLPFEEVEEGRGAAVPREPVGVLGGGGAESRP
ncbi:MAG: alpha-(1-_3)-arabinofuranosyltransferase family protein [Acidimicrobiia bacterium]